MNPRETEARIFDKYRTHLISLDPLLKDIQSRKTLHRGGHRYTKEDKELIDPLKEMSVTVEINLQDVKNYRLEKVAESVYNIMMGFITQFYQTMFKSLAQITDLTGNTLSAGGKPFSLDMVLDMLETIEIPFTNEGEPIMPTFVPGSELAEKVKNTKFTKEQEDRKTKILEEKKKEFYAKKRYRLLSYLD